VEKKGLSGIKEGPVPAKGCREKRKNKFLSGEDERGGDQLVLWNGGRKEQVKKMAGTSVKGGIGAQKRREVAKMGK